MTKIKKIILIHAVEIAIDPIKDAFQSLWPEAELAHIWDESLSIERAKYDTLPPVLFERVNRLVQLAMATNPDAIMFTCSAFGEAIERANELVDIPILKPNQAMFERALSLSTSIGMVGSFAPAIAGMENEFYQSAATLNPTAQVTSICLPAARDALNNNDIELHNSLCLEGAQTLQEQNVIMLAHFSSSYAKHTLERSTGKVVLSSPHSAVEYLKNLLEPT